MTPLAATPLADVLEKEWQAQVRELATTLGYKVFHPYDSRRSAHGWPDLSLLRERLILLELKTEKGRLSAPQKSWLGAMLVAGLEVYVARPRHLEALAQILACRGAPWDRRGPIFGIAVELRDELRKEVAA